MPRYLYLLRHAQSAEKQTGQTDKDRELTVNGMRQSVRIGNYLLEQKTFPDAVFFSSATRTRETASVIVNKLGLSPDVLFPEDEMYEASMRTLLQIIAQFEDKLHHVLCVAHNPGISYLAEYLTKAEIGEMVPAGMAIIEFEAESWGDLYTSRGRLVNYIDADGLT